MESIRKVPQGQPQDKKKAAAEAEKLLNQLQEERLNGAEKKKNKATKKNKAKKSGQGEKRQSKITEEKVWKFFEVISKM